MLDTHSPQEDVPLQQATGPDAPNGIWKVNGKNDIHHSSAWNVHHLDVGALPAAAISPMRTGSNPMIVWQTNTVQINGHRVHMYTVIGGIGGGNTVIALTHNLESALAAAAQEEGARHTGFKINRRSGNRYRKGTAQEL